LYLVILENARNTRGQFTAIQLQIKQSQLSKWSGLNLIPVCLCSQYDTRKRQTIVTLTNHTFVYNTSVEYVFSNLFWECVSLTYDVINPKRYPWINDTELDGLIFVYIRVPI